MQQGSSLRFIAKVISVAASTVSREIKRNSLKEESYKPMKAEALMRERQSYRKYHRVFTKSMMQHIDYYMRTMQWSPEQIVGRCRLKGIPMVGVSRIYSYLHEDKWQGGMLYQHCRHHLKYLKRRLAFPSNKKQGRKSIEERPPIINEQGRMGDVEMDTIVGADGHEAILTLVDRRSGYIIIERLPKGRKAKDLSRIVVKRLQFLKRCKQLHSITTDNGSEFSDFAYIEKRLGIPVYFARPYTSTDKPHIEYLNKLLRQYIPKGKSFNSLTDRDIRRFEGLLNGRPRRKLGFRTPLEVFLLKNSA